MMRVESSLKRAAAGLVISVVFLARTTFAGGADAAGGDPGAAGLLIAPCVASAPMGLRAHLKVEPLSRRDGVYRGSYGITVSPIPVGNETGTLTVAISDEAHRQLLQGSTVKFQGKSANAAGKARTIEGEAKPAGPDHGTMHLRITSERGALTFDTTYRLPGK